MYFEDNTAYTHSSAGGRGNVVNIGWLDAAHPYPRGAVPHDFVRRLRLLCFNGSVRRRGWRRCNLCPSSAPYPVVVVGDDTGAYSVGDSGIRVPGNGGVLYAAPSVIIHYVQAHGYLPPEDFVQAVLGVGAHEIGDSGGG